MLVKVEEEKNQRCHIKKKGGSNMYMQYHIGSVRSTPALNVFRDKLATVLSHSSNQFHMARMVDYLILYCIC